MSGTVATVVVAAAQAATIAVAMTATALWSRRVRRFAVIDAAWGAAFLAAAVVGSVVAEAIDAPGDTWRRWLVTALVVAWGGRLTVHLGGRVTSGSHDDPRYEEMLGGPFEEVPWRTVVAKVFGLQGLAILLIAAPVVAAQVVSTRWWWAVPLGAVVWAVGLFFEAVGDAQLAAYRRDPDRPRILDSGLWAWTRHPNYFGDACVWWGIWAAGALAAGPIAAAVTVLAPVVMTWLLTVVSGARLTERRMTGRPGWAEYAARTPMLVPRPPRRRPS